MGRLSLLVPAGNGKSAARYRALTMPMAAFECVASIKPAREIHPFKDLKPLPLSLQGDLSHPVKSVMAFFLADFFTSVLREPFAEEAMFRLLSELARLLWTLNAARLTNLHILALLRTLDIMGISPDITTFDEKRRFNLTEGVWTRELVACADNKLLDTSESVFLFKLMKMNELNFHFFKFNRDERNLIVDYIIKYLELHGVGKLRLTSLDVLREIF